MCFFKTLPTSPVFPTGFSKVDKNDQEESSDICTSTDLTTLPAQTKALPLNSNQQWLLMNCLGMVDGNSNMLTLMDQVTIHLFRNLMKPLIDSKVVWKVLKKLKLGIKMI